MIYFTHPKVEFVSLDVRHKRGGFFLLIMGGTNSKNSKKQTHESYSDTSSESDGPILRHRKYTQSTKVYVIGKNTNGNLGLSHNDNATALQNIDALEHGNITKIYSAKEYTIYMNHDHNMYVSGLFDWSIGGNKSRAFKNKPRLIKYFKDHNIKIKSVCCNVAYNGSFWISDDNKVYVNGYDSMYCLGIDNGTINDIKLRKRNNVKIKEPTIINHAPFGITDIQYCYNYSLLLRTPSDLLVSSYCNENNYVPPNDIINLIVKYCGMFNLFSTKAFMRQDLRESGFYLEGLGSWNPVQTIRNEKIVKIAAGENHVLFLNIDGNIWSYGDGNGYGQLGLGHSNYAGSNLDKIKYFQKNEIKIIDIQCGANYSLAIDDKYNVYGWGDNGYGQCGENTPKSVSRPTLINGLTQFKIIEIKCGYSHCYAMSDSFDHLLWGSNVFNESTLQNDERMSVPPCRINDIIDKSIKYVSLGAYNTKLIVTENEP